MRITPLDVRKQEFRKGMRGLDPEEVYAFLSTVADEYESVLNDNKALRERLLELDDKVQEYRTMEKTLRDTLLTAERVNADAKDNARREANIIIKEAQIEAEKALRDIKTEAMKLRSQVQQLRSQREAYLARMKVVAKSHLSYIDAAVEDFNKEDRSLGEPDLSEEQLADAPTDEVGGRVEGRRESDLFETAKEVASGDKEVAQATQEDSRAPAAPAPPAPKSAGAPVDAPAVRPAAPVPPAPPVDRVEREPQRQEPTAQTAQGSAAPTGGLPGGGVDPISVIIDRMKKGQQEILSAGAGTPGIPPAHHETRSLESAAEGRNPASTAVAPPVDDGEPEMDVAEVTGQFSLDDLRRKFEDGHEES